MGEEKRGDDFAAVQDPATFDLDSPYGLVMTTIGGVRNHEDSKRKGNAVRAGKRRRVVERGQYIGSRRPFGYRNEASMEACG